MKSNSNKGHNLDGTDQDPIDILLEEAQRRKLKEKWRKELKSINEGKKSKIAFSKELKIVLTVLIITCLVGVFFWLINDKHADLQETAYAMAINTKVYYNSDLVSRSGDGDHKIVADKRKALIQDLLEKEEMLKALNVYRGLELERNLTINDKYIYGILILKNDKEQMEKANLLFSEVYQSSNELKAESLWFLALSYIFLEDYTRATLNLEKLLNMNYKIKEVKLLLEQISQQ